MPWYTLDEAAERLGVAPEEVRALEASGLLARRLGSDDQFIYFLVGERLRESAVSELARWLCGVWRKLPSDEQVPALMNKLRRLPYGLCPVEPGPSVGEVAVPPAAVEDYLRTRLQAVQDGVQHLSERLTRGDTSPQIIKVFNEQLDYMRALSVVLKAEEF